MYPSLPSILQIQKNKGTKDFLKISFLGPDKINIFKSYFDPLERRGERAGGRMVR